VRFLHAANRAPRVSERGRKNILPQISAAIATRRETAFAVTKLGAKVAL
jgi:hypothetical protein